MNEKDLTISVATAFGIEAITKREIVKLGYPDAPANNGRITFKGDMLAVSRLNVFLSTAERVYIEIAKFNAETFDDLYDGLYEIEWDNYLVKNAFVHIVAKSKNSKLFALSSVQSVGNKAIMEKLKRQLNTVILSETGSEYVIELSIDNDVVTVNLDTTGEPLHKRGYRDLSVDAPIKETLASAIIDLSVYSPDKRCIDAFTGSGTFAIETARKALNIASGIDRNFAFNTFDNVDKKYFNLAKEEANDLIEDKKLSISAFDIDENAVSIARHHAKNARVDKYVHFQKMDAREISSKYPYGVIFANPPYGERLMTEKQVSALYSDFARTFFALSDWSLYLITAYPKLEQAFNKKATKTRKLFNGNIECRLYQYMGKKPPKHV